jgi:sugar lactone lactonase YvrE
MSVLSKIKITIILSLGITFASRWLPAFSQGQKPAWKGKIVAENGVKIVKNPTAPLYGEFACQLEEDLSVGGNVNDDNYYFPRGIFALNVDGDGNIYVSDFGNIRIQMYDKAGKFVRTLGRKGQGPGEFQMPRKVLFDSKDNPWVFDVMTLHQFDKNGTFQRQITLKTYLQDYFISTQGSIFGTTRSLRPEPGGPKESVVKLDPEGGIVQTVAEFRGELTKSRNAIVWHQYTSQLYFSPVNTTTFCYGFSMEYRIFIADADGKTILVIEKEEKPQSISAKEQAWTKKNSPISWQSRTPDAKPREEMVFPEHRPYFGGFMADDGGRIYVMRLKSVLDESPEFAFDVFSKDGYYIYKMKLPFKPALIKVGFVYEIREDKESGDFKIIRYKIRNWEQIKDRI